jgi:hypothetical protein
MLVSRQVIRHVFACFLLIRTGASEEVIADQCGEWVMGMKGVVAHVSDWDDGRARPVKVTLKHKR